MINTNAIELLEELRECKFLANHLILNRIYNLKCMQIAKINGDRIKSIRKSLDNLKE